MNARKSMLRTLVAAALATALGILPAGAQITPQPAPCPFPIDPAPTGINDAPPDIFADPALFSSPSTSNDYHWIHSSVHLQGTQALQKWGACVFFNPPRALTTPVDMTDWRSALVVNNPSPTVTVTARITYRDPAGNTLASFSTTLAPEATFVRGAVELRQFGGPGIGSVEVTADHPIVGATLHHFGRMTLSNGLTVTDPDIIPATPVPGANSMQQLQISQDYSTTLFSGPFPAANNQIEDFLNGVLPLNCVLNPNNTPATVTVASFISPGTPLTSQTVTIPAFGMFLDTSIWAVAEPFYLSNPGPFNLDVIAAAFSNGNPILGDFLMVDVFGNSTTSNLRPGRRFRMGSGMMQNAPALRLINPEHVETGPLAIPLVPPLPSTPPVETMMSVANVTGVDIGPVNVTFFNRVGTQVANLSFASLPPGAVQRITPATSGIPQNFAGWARITACRSGLIGWTMREVWDQQDPFSLNEPPLPPAHFRKVYGEELNGANGSEPGKGFPVVDANGDTWIREVAPLQRAAGNFSNPNWWPGYVNAVNHASSNIGSYWHRFFTLPGVLAGQQNFVGLRFANTSFTYVDPIVNLIAFPANISGRFDREGGQALGMEAIGDPLQEWGIPLFLGPDVGTVLPDVIHSDVIH